MASAPYPVRLSFRGSGVQNSRVWGPQPPRRKVVRFRHSMPCSLRILDRSRTELGARSCRFIANPRQAVASALAGVSALAFVDSAFLVSAVNSRCLLLGQGPLSGSRQASRWNEDWSCTQCRRGSCLGIGDTTPEPEDFLNIDLPSGSRTKLQISLELWIGLPLPFC